MFDEKIIIVILLIINRILIFLIKENNNNNKENHEMFSEKEYRDFIKVHLCIFNDKKLLLSKNIKYIDEETVKCLKMAKIGAVLISKSNMQLFK